MEIHQRRRRSLHSEHEWESIRPLIKQWYIVQGLTLHYIQLTLRLEHGFEASEQMLKKRLKQWGMRKNQTSKSKAKDCELVNTGHDAGIRSGGTMPLTSYDLTGSDAQTDHPLHQQIKILSALTSNDHLHINANTFHLATVCLLPALTIDIPLLKSMHAARLMVLTHEIGPFALAHAVSHHISLSVEEGRRHLKLGAFALARSCFFRAGIFVTGAFMSGVVPDLLLSSYVLAACTTGSPLELQSFARLVINQAQLHLPISHPFRNFTACISQIGNDRDEAARVWQCIETATHDTKSADQISHFALWRLQYSVVLQDPQRALHSCEITSVKLAEQGLLTATVQRCILYLAALALMAQGYVLQAKAHFQLIISSCPSDITDQGLSTRDSQCWRLMGAHQRLAQILEFYDHDLLAAEQHYTIAFQIAIEDYGYASLPALDIFVQILSFYRRHQLQEKMQAFLQKGWDAGIVMHLKTVWTGRWTPEPLTLQHISSLRFPKSGRNTVPGPARCLRLARPGTSDNSFWVEA